MPSRRFTLNWFFEESSFELMDEDSERAYQGKLDMIEPLTALIESHQPDVDKDDVNFMKEFVLWALVEFQKLSKKRSTEGFEFRALGV